MNWVKNGTALSIEAVIERNTGIPIAEFLNPPSNPYIGGLEDAAKMIDDAISAGDVITIYGDYDADGITATAILYLLLSNLAHDKVEVILPKRFSEGYGLSAKGVDRINSGLLITIDNGITAVDEVEMAKAKGLKVLIVDHHLPREDGRIPNADVIVDPNAIPGSDFNSYCGAGLAFKLASLMLDDKDTLDKLCALAAIGTVADVMPLIYDNRNIVVRGLESLNHGKNFPGIAALLRRLEMYEVTETDIGFKIGPVINAAGRMRDDGAMEAFRLLVGDSFYASRAADHLVMTNEERKQVVAQGVEICERIIAEDCLFGENPLLVYTTKDSGCTLHEGVVGILAGRLAEKYKVPAIVLTEIEGGILKGSGRSAGDVHLKSVLDQASDILAGYGGHAGAAGLAVHKDNVEELRYRLQDIIAEMDIPVEADIDTQLYDLEVNAFQIPDVMKKLKNFAPFGEGNPQIIFKVNNVRLMPRGGKTYRLMGADGQHLKLFGQNYDVVGFDMANRFKEENEPSCIDTIGYISENRFGMNTTLQIELIDFKKRENVRPQSQLADILAKKMKEKGFA